MENEKLYAIETKSLKVGYDKVIIVPDFNIQLEKGKITSIIGANGCGKSTLLKAIGRIIPKEQGSIIINQNDVSNLKSKDIAKEMAILPQSPQAPGTLTVFELVSYGRFPYQKGFGRLNEEDKKIVNWALDATNMSEFKDREIAYLSGGQRQRAWIAMALAQQTGIILLDEPTTYLDLCHQLEVLELLKELNEKDKVTIVMVLHDLNLASKYSDKLLAMKKGEIYKYGTPHEVLTADMLKECFRIDGTILIDEKINKPLCFNYDLFKEDLNNKKEDEASGDAE